MSHVGLTPGLGHKGPVSAPPKTVSPRGTRRRHSPPGPRTLLRPQSGIIILCPGHGTNPVAPSGFLLARAAGRLPRPQPGLSWSVPSGPPIEPLPPKGPAPAGPRGPVSSLAGPAGGPVARARPRLGLPGHHLLNPLAGYRKARRPGQARGLPSTI